MKSQRLFAALVLFTAIVVALTAPGPVAPGARAQSSGELPTLALSPHVSGLSSPVVIAHAGDGTNRLFIAEQGGRVRLFKNGALQPTPFLDIAGRISAGGERGLLGLAFPEGYAAKGYFYVNYTNTAGHTVVSRFQRSASDPDVADPSSEQIVIVVNQPFANHNGGQLAFGPRDGFLYAGRGDGGSGGDPFNNAQNPAQLLGKLLRLDVEGGRPYTYTVPDTNPFVNRAGFRPEIWALGLRNPWRFSFDRLTADLYIADVGQGAFEEVNFQAGASTGGENYGWRIMEGAHCFNPNPCDPTGLVLPVHEYGHGAGDCSVTGGYVYRATEFPRMRGLYIYGDYCSGRIWALRRSGAAWQNSLLLDTNINISTFGEDEAGNLYVASHNTGQIFKLVDNAPALPPAPTPTPPALQFNTASLNVNEDGLSVRVNVVRTGDPAPEVFVDYATADGTASGRGDYTTAQGTLRFAPNETSKPLDILLTDDSLDEANETMQLVLSNPRGGASLGSPSVFQVTILDNDPPSPPANPIDNTTFFVRQHYHDFLNRAPDDAGLAFWSNKIEACGANAQCREVQRIDTSAAFFLAIEFQETGFLVYRLHKAAFGELPRFRPFVADTQQMGRGVAVGVGEWARQLEANRRALVNEFVTRPAFVTLYPTGQTPAAYVDTLNARAGGVLSPAERDDLVARLADGRETRATALRRVAEDDDFERLELNRAFVLMQYFGYLRRNPDEPDWRGLPDPNFNGYNFWLDRLERHGGDFRAAEMVKAFITSIEYRQRFGP